MQIRFTRGARKHRIGLAHALHVMLSVEPEFVGASPTSDPRLEWFGPDDRGVNVHIVALLLIETQELLVIHVMPSYRGRP